MFPGHWIPFLRKSSCRSFNVGGSPSKSEETPLECILKNCKFLKIVGLRKETLKVYCNSDCPLWKLGGWRGNGLKMGL